MKSNLKVGAHVSTAGGLSKSVGRAVEIGANCFQIFSSSPRMWLADLPSGEEVEKFKKEMEKTKMGEVFIHAKYLVNLASEKPELVEKSIASLVYDLKVAEMIGAVGVVVHLGSHMGRGFEVVKNELMRNIKEALSQAPGKAMLLAENSAGQKGKIASQLSELRFLLGSVNDDRFGWCLDTCHGWAAGYFSGKPPVNSLIQYDVVEEIKKFKLESSLKVLHVNDSRDEFGSGRDRHDNLGEGLMGLETLSSWVNQPVFKGLPMILEVPGFEGKGPDRKNIEILKKMINEG